MIPAGVVTENVELRAAPRWRREPYLVFFPLGVALAWAGVGQWMMFAIGATDRYRSIFHAMTQIQGFLLCFAVGFLFTMIPRRTGSAPPAAWEMAVGVVAPVVTVVAAWREAWMLSQLGWLALCATLIAFVVRRFVSSSSTRRPPNSFVWIPVALLMGLVGSLMTSAYGVFGPEYRWMHQMGSTMLLQGVFVSLVLGVGGLALPLMTRGQAPADATAEGSDLAARLGHLSAAGALLWSFAIEAAGDLASAYALRAVVVSIVLLLGPELWKPPLADGWNRRLIWLAAWMLPVGFLLAAAFPLHAKGAMHVSYIGGFAVLALAVGLQVTLAHGGYRSAMLGRPWPVAAIGVLGALSIATRVAMDFDPPRFFLWMGWSAATFLAATVVWMVFLVPRMVRPGAEP